MNCIAHTKANGCKRLTVDKCTGSNCLFYQTRNQAKASREKADNRLANLDDLLQEYFADKYYNGRYPWLRKDNTYGR